MKVKYEFVSKNCVNSNWTARFLATGKEEHCQCSFGDCKIRVSIEHNGHNPYVFILTEKEIERLNSNP